MQVSGLRTRLKQSVNQPGRDRSVSGLGCDGRTLVIAPKVLTRRSLGWQTRLEQSVNQPGRDRTVSGLGCDGRALVIAPKVLTRRSLGWQTRLKQSVNQPHVQLTKLAKKLLHCWFNRFWFCFWCKAGDNLTITINQKLREVPFD